MFFVEIYDICISIVTLLCDVQVLPLQQNSLHSDFHEYFLINSTNQNENRDLLFSNICIGFGSKRFPSNFIAGHSKAALLFWSFGDLDVVSGHLLFFSLDIDIEVGKSRYN